MCVLRHSVLLIIVSSNPFKKTSSSQCRTAIKVIKISDAMSKRAPNIHTNDWINILRIIDAKHKRYGNICYSMFAWEQARMQHHYPTNKSIEIKAIQRFLRLDNERDRKLSHMKSHSVVIFCFTVAFRAFFSSFSRLIIANCLMIDRTYFSPLRHEPSNNSHAKRDKKANEKTKL